MSDGKYIDREDLIKRLEASPLLNLWYDCVVAKDGILDLVAKFPAADVVPKSELDEANGIIDMLQNVVENLRASVEELREKNAGLALACLLECPPNDDLRQGVWKNRAEHNDYIWCECSECGFREEAWKTVKTGTSSSDYVDVKWHFCPKCGAIMSV